MVEGGSVHEECSVSPPFEDRAAANHRVGECDVSAFDAPLTDEGLKRVERLSDDVFHHFLRPASTIASSSSTHPNTMTGGVVDATLFTMMKCPLGSAS